MQQTATDMGSIGFDNTFGYGRLNAFAAIQAIYPTLSGPSTICTSGSAFSVSNLPSSVLSVVWETGPYLTVFSGQNTNSPLIKATGSGSSWVRARLVTACGELALPQNC
ncbi:MAG: hypothetical protein ACK5JD_17240 [Mangrovibacterium sp.]